ncbi:MAG: 2TM domain-containing protein [Bryobacterales bacterium]|nr:2TM domain-containing protein [Bryobacterales bacterium]
MFFRRNPISPIIGFVKHLAVFVPVNIFLFGVNLFAGGEWWFGKVLFGWGTGLLIHAVAAGLLCVRGLARLGR